MMGEKEEEFNWIELMEPNSKANPQGRVSLIQPRGQGYFCTNSIDRPCSEIGCYNSELTG